MRSKYPPSTYTHALNSFEPTAYVKSWLDVGRHAATDMGNTKKRKRFRAGPGQVAI